MNIADYCNFDLLIARAGDRYRAFVVDAPAGEASVLFDLPFAPNEVSRLGGLVRGVRRHLGAAGEPGRAASLADLGTRLFGAVFRDKVGTLLAQSLSSVAQEGAGLRLRLRFEEDAADLALLPWETLYDPDLGHFVGLGEGSPILRYLSLPRSRSALLVEPPLRVQAVLASPAGLPALDMDREWHAIQDALAGLVGDGKFVLERLTSPTLDALQQRLSGEPVHILHFVGHGVFDEASQAGCLALEDARGRPQLVRGEQLAAILRDHPALRLAYLNACEGALASGGSVFAGVAQALVREGVPAAVAMQAEISDSGAIELAHTFYTALAAGRPVDAALTQARVALSAADSPEWAIPVLFSRSPDNRLFDIREVLPTPDCPYPGMAPFSETQRELFFGRERETEEAVERLRQHPFLAVVGPSGCGKSSLIYAGVIPALRRSRRFGPGEWDILILRPSDSRTADGKAAPHQALAVLLGGSSDVLADHTFEQRTLLLIDQFEELFTLAAADEAQAFLAALGGLMGRPDLYILLTVRADFYPELMACSLWQPISANRLELTPLGDDELWAAIVEPAGQVGVTVDEALAVRLIADAAGERGSLPLVQETLVLLWDKVESRELKLAAYRGMAEGDRSGLQVAIDRRASSVYNNLPQDAQAIARRIFLRLIQFGEGRADTRRQQTAAELRASGDDPALFNPTLARLIESRLLTASGEAGDANRRIDIAHEALIAGWPRLQEWLSQRRAAEQTRRRLEGKAAEWVGAEKRGGLLDEYELQEAEKWLAAEDAQELGYKRDLIDLVAASKAGIAQAKAREAEADRNRQRFQLSAIGLVLAVIVIALVGGFWRQARLSQETAETAATAEATARTQAVDEANKAATSEAEAHAARETAVAAKAETERLFRQVRADQVAARALERFDQNPIASILVASEVMIRQERAGERFLLSTEGTLFGMLTRTGGLPMVGHRGPVSAISFGGQWLASASEDHTVRLWDWTRFPYSSTVLSEQLAGDALVVFSHDRRWLAIASGHAISVWDPRKPTNDPMVLPGDIDSSITSVTFSPDNLWLAASTWDGVFLWKVSDLESEPIPLRSSDRRLFVTLAFSPDSGWLAAAGLPPYGPVIWNMRDRAADPRTLEYSDSEHRTQYIKRILAFRPDGRMLAVSGETNEVRLWDMDVPESDPLVLKAHEGTVTAMAFSEDSLWLATGDEIGAARLWDLGSAGVDSVLLDGHKGPITSIAFGPWGGEVATASKDKTIRIWEVSDRQHGDAESTLYGHTESVTALDWSVSNLLMSASADGTVRTWSLEGGAFALPIESFSDWKVAPISKLAFRPNGDIVLGVKRSSSDFRLYELPELNMTWSPESYVHGIPRIHVDKPESDLDSLGLWDDWDFDFSADGRWLATYSRDKVWVGDLARPKESEPIILQLDVGDLTAAAFHPDGRLIATADYGETVTLWTVGNAQKQTIPFNGADIALLAFSNPDGRWLAGIANSEYVSLWDMNQPHAQPRILGYGDGIDALAFSHDGHWLATGHDNHILRLFDMKSSKIESSIIGSHDAGVTSVAFSPDGQWLSSGSDDGTIRLWNMADLQVAPISFTGHAGTVTSLAFSSDSRWLASGGRDGKVNIWTLDARLMIEMTCSIAGRNLTYDEWIQFFPNEPYRRTCWDWPTHSTVILARIADVWRSVGRIEDFDQATSQFAQAIQAIEQDPSLEQQTREEVIHHATDLLTSDEFLYPIAVSGEYTQAMRAPALAHAINPDVDVTPLVSLDAWDYLCRYGSIDGAAAAVMIACENAVSLAPEDGSIHESRGLARALVGDNEGAIRDFEFTVRWAEQAGMEAAFIESRRAWIEALKTGDNPFDAATLEKLRSQ